MIPLCPICGDTARLTNPKYPNQGYKKTCGRKDCIVNLRKQTNQEKYGNPVPIHGSLRPAMMKNLQDRYGVTNVSFIPEVQKKKIETCRRTHGVDFPMESRDVRKKSVITCFAKYGVSNVFKLVEKIREAQLAIDPETGLTSWERGLATRKSKNLSKYGCYFLQTEEFKQKSIDKMMERFGTDNYFKSKAFHNQMVEAGVRYSEADLTQMREYKRVVANITRETMRTYGFLLPRPDTSTHHLDHIFSISEGFKQGVPAEIIGSIINLQILPKKKNLEKGSDCWITLPELLERHRVLKEGSGE